ncbi:MAG: hypothetical protein EOP41_00430 [Sphingobacteriaceae bacterium]|nr:MAG: hypothetical protein EOP41_00430 [Sphingobacteriaceae bacterium]
MMRLIVLFFLMYGFTLPPDEGTAVRAGNHSFTIQWISFNNAKAGTVMIKPTWLHRNFRTIVSSRSGWKVVANLSHNQEIIKKLTFLINCFIIIPPLNECIRYVNP